MTHTPGPWSFRKGHYSPEWREDTYIVETADKRPTSAGGKIHQDVCHMLTEPNARLIAKAPEMLETLESIARNTCCSPCQEAATVAARALGVYRCYKCAALNKIVNQCGCDPNNLPTKAERRTP